jgi:hypothetical protein
MLSDSPFFQTLGIEDPEANDMDSPSFYINVGATLSEKGSINFL